MTSVFFSHSHEDEAFVIELSRRLTRDGVECYYDRKGDRWGPERVLAVEQGVAMCEFFLPILSQAFDAARWRDVDRTRIRPLLLGLREIPAPLQGVECFDVSGPAFERNYPRICKLLGVRPFLRAFEAAHARVRNVLTGMAHLGPSPAPTKLLLKTLGFPEAQLSRAIAAAHRLELLDEADTHSPRASRALLTFVRQRTKTSGLRRRAKYAVLDEMHRTQDIGDTAARWELEAAIPHTLYVAERKGTELDESVALLDAIGWLLRVHGRPREALAVRRRAVRKAKELGLDHFRYAICQANLGMVYFDLGRFAEGEGLMREALMAEIRHRRSNRAVIAVRKDNLAKILRKTGKFKAAVSLTCAAVASDEKEFGAADPRTVRRCANHAVNLACDGQWGEADRYFRKALTAGERCLGSGHPLLGRIARAEAQSHEQHWECRTRPTWPSE